MSFEPRILAIAKGGTGSNIASVDGTIRSTLQTVPASGTGIEVFYDTVGGLGACVAYDRTGGTHKPLFIEGSILALNSAVTSGNVGVGTDTPSSRLHVNGSISVKRTAVGAGDYTVLTTDYYIGKTAITLTGDTINLPAAATAGVGKVYIIKDESGTATIRTITIDPSGAETIDGGATATIILSYGSRTIICDGSAWFTI